MCIRDSIKSDVFAKTAAAVLAANGIKVRIYDALMPVPALSFATRYYECNAGIMVTASHNPAKLSLIHILPVPVIFHIAIQIIVLYTQEHTIMIPSLAGLKPLRKNSKTMLFVTSVLQKKKVIILV